MILLNMNLFGYNFIKDVRHKIVLKEYITYKSGYSLLPKKDKNNVFNKTGVNFFGITNQIHLEVL
jgi:hypothetical protein